MSDENVSGTSIPPATPAGGGAFDWLIESHQSSVPMAPLTDDIPAPAPAPVPAPVAAPRSFEFPDPAARPPQANSFPDLLRRAEAAPEPVPPLQPPQPSYAPPPPEVTMQAPVQAVPLQAAPVQPAPVFPNPVPPTPTQAPFQAPVFETPAPAPLAPVFETPGPAPLAPVVEYTPPLSALAPAALPPVAEPPVAEPPQSAPFSFGSAPLAPSTFGGTGSAPALVLERRPDAPRSANGPLDWIAFVLAFLAPPVGLVLGVIAVLTGPKIKGYATSVAKAAIGIGAALSVVLGVAVVVVNKIDHDQATHAAIVASSAAYCAKLTATPATLTSDTYGWPAPEDTIPESITAIKTYETYWESLAKIAPAGIEADTQKFADTAKSIAATVQSTQTLNDEGNVVQIQNLVAQSGIKSWVSNYCN